MDDTTIPTPAELKSAIRAAGVSQAAVARAAKLPSSTLSILLSGRDYLGPRRAARLQAALHQLALEVEAKRAAEQAATADAQPEPERKERPQPRIRRL